MLTVMLVNDGSGRAAALKEALAAAGVRVVAEVQATPQLADVLAAARPDVVLIDSDAPARDMLEQVCVMGSQHGQPVVMFTGDDSRETMRSALQEIVIWASIMCIDIMCMDMHGDHANGYTQR